MTIANYIDLITERQLRLERIALELGVWNNTTGEHIDIQVDNNETDNLVIEMLKGGEDLANSNK